MHDGGSIGDALINAPGAVLAAVVVAGVGQWIAWRIGFPSVLVLLLAGLALGPGLDVVDPDATFGGLASVTTSAGGRQSTISFGRDGDGQPVSLSFAPAGQPAAAVEHRFVWGTVAGRPQILSQAGPHAADFVYGYHRSLALSAARSVPFSVDAAGSTLPTPATGRWAGGAGYTTFGGPLDEGKAPVPGPRFGYRGELTVYDDVHLRARVYDPVLGRFTTPDPLDGVAGEAAASNPYHYAGNNPRNRIDPLGLRPNDAEIDRGWGVSPPPWVTLPAPPVAPFAPPGSRGFFPRWASRVGAVALAVVADVLLDAKPAGRPDENRYCVYCDDGPRVIWRGGSRTNTALTPRPGNDTRDYPQNGLSTWITKQEACVKQTKASPRSVELLEAFPGLRLQNDYKKPSHIFVQGETMQLHTDWAASRPAADAAPHRLTLGVIAALVTPEALRCP